MARLEFVWSTLLATIIVLGAVVWGMVSLDPKRPSPERIVQEFVSAHNARNVSGMLALATEDVEWMNVSAAGAAVETRGRDALRDTTESYFRSCPSCQTSVEQVRRAGSRVTAVERAIWDTSAGGHSRRSLSVYEFRGGLISRVYYFPAD